MTSARLQDARSAYPAKAAAPEFRPSERESAVTALTAIHLCFLPWALGTMHVESQLVSLALGALGFAVAAWPGSKSRPAAALLRFPVFWAGLVLLVLITVQALNPAWKYSRDDTGWWLESLSHVPWLPAGIGAPLDRSNPWRALIVLGSLWLLLGAIWIGVRRQVSLERLFAVLIGNAVLLAALALAQKLAGAKEIFWTYRPSNESFVASFIYPNHASPYFNLMAAVALGLAWQRYRRVRVGRAGIAGARLLTVAAVLCGIAVVFTFSRAAIVLLLGFACAIGLVIAIRRSSPQKHSSEHPEFLPLALGLVLALGAGLGSLTADRLQVRFAPLLTDPAATALSRRVASQATAEMFLDRWIWGWGAGCFRHAFPLFARHHPQIYGDDSTGRKYWEHAHNDLLQFPAELGVVGMAPLGFAALWAARRLVRKRFWRQPTALSGIAGCGITLLHASVDFVFQNPAVLLTWGTVLIVLLRWPDAQPPMPATGRPARIPAQDQPPPDST